MTSSQKRAGLAKNYVTFLIPQKNYVTSLNHRNYVTYYVTGRFLSECLLAFNMSNEAGEKKHEERKQSLINALIIVKMIGPNMRRTQPESAWSTDLQDDSDVEVEVEALPPNDALDLNCEVY